MGTVFTVRTALRVGAKLAQRSLPGDSETNLDHHAVDRQTAVDNSSIRSPSLTSLAALRLAPATVVNCD